jgi:putative transposase
VFGAGSEFVEERIAVELLLKLGIALSPRTVGRYMRTLRPVRPGARPQTWSTVVRNHAREVLACDFYMTVTARFRLLYVFIVLDVGTRRLVRWNVTEHPTGTWVVRQFRTCITPREHASFHGHDRDSVYSEGAELALRTMGLSVLKTPVQTKVERAN